MPAEERTKPLALDQSPPATLKEWARFVCPDQARQIFRANSSSSCINVNSIAKQVQLPNTSFLHFFLYFSFEKQFKSQQVIDS